MTSNIIYAQLKNKCTFTARTVPSATWLEVMKDYSTKLPWHESVLRPLLESATERWAYELQPNSDAFFAA